MVVERLVKNLSRQQEGFIAAASLQLIIGSSSHERSPRLGGKETLSSLLSHGYRFILISSLQNLCFILADPGNLKVRKLSSP